MKRNLSFYLVFSLLGIFVVLGVLQLFELRFRSGDIFPPYSSYRADPKGTRILYESLLEYPGVETERLIKPLNEEDAAGRTVLFLGSEYYSVIRNFDEVIESYLKAGGHAVIAFSSVDPIFKRVEDEACDSCSSETNTVPEIEETAMGSEEVDPVDEPTDNELTDDAKDHDPETCRHCRQREREERWQVQFEVFTHDELEELDPEEYARPVNGKEELGFLPWSSALFFTEVGDAWSVVYEYLGKPAVIERKWGKGSIILMSDSYLFSNEAMVVERHTPELIRMLGSPGRIQFDEIHLGVESQEGVMMLVNRYRLTGVLYAVLLLIALYVWQKSSSFIPKYTDPNEGGVDVGITVDSRQGFTNLLARHIPHNELLKTMVDEWRSTFSRKPLMQKKTELLNAEFQKKNESGKKEHPVDTYNRLLNHLNERK